jgi:hypothetical protein
MKSKSPIILIAVFAVFLISAVAVFGGFENISFPIPELGNCKDIADCDAYCNSPANQNACIEYSIKSGNFSEEESAILQKFMSGELSGPGGCKTEIECKAYCDGLNHLGECIKFAEENNMMSQEQLEDSKKMLAAINSGIKPPACKNEAECDIYCKESDHMEECITFGIAAGFIQGKELEESKKVLQAVRKGVQAPNCMGDEECGVYCSQEAHLDECLNFGVAAGFVTEEEAKMVKQSFGKGPGGCSGKEECDAYCAVHQTECEQFNPVKPNFKYDKITNKKIEDIKGPVAEEYKVSRVEAKEQGVLIEGTAPPNSIITVYIYSVPTVVIIQADASGNWKYSLDKPLADGRHTVYASVTNNKGDIEKVSQAFNFSKIEDKIIEILASTNDTTKSPGQNIARLFIIMIGITIVLAFVFAMLVLGNYFKNNANPDFVKK